MSKKPKKSRHRQFVQSRLIADEITPEYQAEIDRSMSNLTARYEREQKKLAKAEQKRQRIERQQQDAQAKAEAAEAAVARQLDEERRLGERLETIRLAAQRARVESARREQQKRREEVESARRVSQLHRRSQQRLAKEERERLARSRIALTSVDRDIAEHRRELDEIRRLMMPGNYAGREHRGTKSIRHTS